MASSVTFDLRQPVDFAIIGSGSAGGIIAKELSTAGFNVVVFEQGPYRKAQDFTHDEYSVLFADELLGGGPRISGQTFRSDASKTAESPESQPIRYAQTVGGSSFVTSGRGQPTMTIMALAFRAAHHIKITASAGEI